ncbi:hypothetical protein ACJ41O_008791 [Fusarium nematophilum]
MGAPIPRCCGTKLPTYLGFAILGLVNAVVPFIVHSANYLIIPYPRCIVLLIETLPALLTKLLLPHVLHRVPYWMRPLTVGAGWIVVAVVTKVTPPNIAPPLRVLTSALASVSAAAMETSFLGMTRYYGKAGLAGWGAGVGAGAVFCAVLPFVLTVWMEAFLRSFIDCIYALTGAMLVAFFVVLPGAPVNYPDARRHDSAKVDVEDQGLLLVEDPVEELSRVLSTRNRVTLAKAVVRPYMVPLFVAFAAQTLVYPGISRALPISSSFETFFAYVTSYGLAFQLGSFVSRALTPMFRPQDTIRPAFVVLGVVTAATIVNSTLLVFSSHVLVGLLAFCAGVGGGAVYMAVFGKALEEKALESGINMEFGLQVCDEQGPPCTGCAARNFQDCSYLPEPPSQLPATETRRRLELELMHRWSVTTHKSLVSIPEDALWLQDDMPRWALKHEYLLHGMFALSALDVALTGGSVVDDDPAVYVRLALEYYDKASRSFRAQLENVTPENVQKVFLFSFLAVAVNMCLPQCGDIIPIDDDQEGILRRVVTLWELLMGNASIANKHFDALISGALSRSTEALMVRTQMQNQTPVSISQETEKALEKLSLVVEKAAAESPQSDDPEASTEAGLRVQAYRAGVAAIRTCFVEDSKDLFKGIAIAFPAMAGMEFFAALKRSDRVAVFVMMFWGVQLDCLGKLAWWVGSFGRKMVSELSEMLWEGGEGADVEEMGEWRECISWARREVELPPLGRTEEEEVY